MLTFEEKLAILGSFPELERKDVSLGRVNFHYENSAYDKKAVVYHLHPNGNGYVYAGQLQGYSTDDKGFVNIRDYAADELRSIIDESIRSLTSNSAEIRDNKASRQEERWIGPNDESLTVIYEDDLWYIYAGFNLDSAFETYDEAKQYLLEEGFHHE